MGSSNSDTSLDFHVGFNTRGREIISHNGGPRGCALRGPPSQ